MAQRGGTDPGGEGQARRPAAARPSATVVLARQAQGGVEALLLRRPPRSAFAPDAWVFPGGVVDPGDRRIPDQLLAGRGAAGWARRLGVPDPAEAVGYVAAAIREAWEEAGILLAEGAGGVAPERLHRARLALLGGAPLDEVLRGEGVRLAADDLLYIGHWVTPEAEPRRYDTRFFLARVGPATECRLHGGELAEACWAAPAEAVASWRHGRMRLLPPTAHTLQRLAAHPTLDDLWSALCGAPVPRILPCLPGVEDGVVIDMPAERGG